MRTRPHTSLEPKRPMGRLAHARAHFHHGPEPEMLRQEAEDMSAVDPSCSAITAARAQAVGNEERP